MSALSDNDRMLPHPLPLPPRWFWPWSSPSRRGRRWGRRLARELAASIEDRAAEAYRRGWARGGDGIGGRTDD